MCDSLQICEIGVICGFSNSGFRFIGVLRWRTHQIRVHLASLGHPIVGDKIYGPDEKLYLQFIETGWTPELAHRLLLPRHALHSAALEIEGGEKWISPLPGDLAKFVNGADQG